MPAKFKLVVNLDETTFRCLEALARQCSRTPGRMGALVLRQAIADRSAAVDSAGQIEAEQALLHWLSSTIEKIRLEDRWGEDVTLTVFHRIAAEQPDLYQAAVASAGTTRVNREIGSMVRKGLNARAKLSNGSPVKVKPRRDQSGLITSYTLLERQP